MSSWVRKAPTSSDENLSSPAADATAVDSLTQAENEPSMTEPTATPSSQKNSPAGEEGEFVEEPIPVRPPRRIPVASKAATISRATGALGARANIAPLSLDLVGSKSKTASPRSRRTKDSPRSPKSARSNKPSKSSSSSSTESPLSARRGKSGKSSKSGSKSSRSSDSPRRHKKSSSSSSSASASSSPRSKLASTSLESPRSKLASSSSNSPSDLVESVAVSSSDRAASPIGSPKDSSTRAGRGARRPQSTAVTSASVSLSSSASSSSASTSHPAYSTDAPSSPFPSSASGSDSEPPSPFQLSYATLSRSSRSHRRQGLLLDNMLMAKEENSSEWMILSMYERSSPSTVLRDLFGSTLEGLGMDSKVIPQLLDLIELRMPLDMKSSCRSRSAIRAMASATEGWRAHLAKQRALADVVLVQSIFRMKRSRVEYLSLQKIYGSTGPLHKRNVQFRAYLRMERGYVARLRSVVDCYYKPLFNDLSSLSRGSSKCSQEDLDDVFANVQLILELHASLLKKLDRLQRKSWPKIDSFASTIESYLPALRRYYSEYANHFKFSIHSLTVLCENNARLQEMITTLGETHQAQPLSTLLAVPLNHPASCGMLMQSILDDSPPDLVSSEDRGSLARVAQYLKQSSLEIASKLEGADSFANVVKAKRSITDWKEVVPELNSLNLHHEMDAPVMLYDSAHKRCQSGFHLWVFDELFLVTRVDSRRNHVVHRKLLMSDGKLVVASAGEGQWSLNQEIEDEMGDATRLFNKTHSLSPSSPRVSRSAPSAAGLDRVPSASSETDKLYFGCIASEPLAVLEERSTWIKACNRMIAQAANRQVFGVPLSTLAERCTASGVLMPPIFTDCLAFILDSGGFETQGIFRISGKKGTIQHLQSLYNRGLPLSLKQEDASVHDVASLVKLWLRKLPEPLFTFALYQPMLDTYQAFEDCQDVEALLANVAAKCQQLPLINRRIMVRLFDYLREATFHSEETQMESKNLAIVFGPTLLRPKEDSLESSLFIVKINELVRLLIENSSALSCLE